MFYGLATILLVEIPDMEADRLGQKKTWVAQRGRQFGFTAIGLLLLIATVCLFLLPLAYRITLSFNFRLLEYLSLLPLGAGILGMIKRPTDRIEAIRLMNTIIAASAVFFVITDIALFIAAT